MFKLTRRVAALFLATHISLFAANGQVPSVQMGGAVDILADIRSHPSHVKIVNFWATWCLSCREEIPKYQRLGRDFAAQNVRVLFVSIDYSENLPELKRHLARFGVKDLSYVRSGAERDFFRAFHSDWSGSLPATVIFGPDGNVVDFWEGTISLEDLKERVRRAVDTAKVPEQSQQSEDQ